ncbi:MAG: LysR substrate-binding domain-containing protein, partial [Neomegalonema sp.]|nr:LysR substrate-binding domain-containing protein [Neomegalonema sp.]
DLAVRFGRPRQDGHFSELLSREWTTPMARPDVAAKLQRPADLLEHTLIYDEGFTEIEPSATWETWFAQFDIDLAAAPRRLAVNQSDHALDYVIQNGGVALGRYTIAMESLRSGALAAPFDVALPSEAQFRIVCPRGRQELPAIAAFRNWLKGHVERDQAMVGAHGVQLRET